MKASELTERQRELLLARLVFEQILCGLSHGERGLSQSEIVAMERGGLFYENGYLAPAGRELAEKISSESE